MKNALRIIYVQLLNEGTICYRTILALKTKYKNKYKIISQNYPKISFEEWEFEENQIVRCEKRQLSEGEHYVAIAKI